MSRLDDELRSLYSRKEPSPDFADLVMRQVAARQAQQKQGFWQSLTDWFARPRMRWVAVGAVSAAVLIIASVQLSSRGRDVTVPPSDEPPTVTASGVHHKGEESRPSAPPEQTIQPVAVASGPKRISRPARRAVRTAKPLQDKELIAKGEAAKQQIMLALHIASSTLSEAQKIIRSDSDVAGTAPKNKK